jgi:hypothetical protein
MDRRRPVDGPAGSLPATGTDGPGTEEAIKADGNERRIHRPSHERHHALAPCALVERSAQGMSSASSTTDGSAASRGSTRSSMRSLAESVRRWAVRRTQLGQIHAELPQRSADRHEGQLALGQRDALAQQHPRPARLGSTAPLGVFSLLVKPLSRREWSTSGPEAGRA